MNIQHSSTTQEWGTPPNVLDRVRRVLAGGIDLDPASSWHWNKNVQAERIFTKQDDALKHEWHAERLFCNPPGGKVGNKSLTVMFWSKLLQEFAAEHVRHAVFMGFSLECLATTQQCSVGVIDVTFCVPRRRMKFVNLGVEKTQPSHANVIALLSGSSTVLNRFVAEFSELGKVIVQ